MRRGLERSQRSRRPRAALGIGIPLRAPLPDRCHRARLDVGVDGLDRGVEIGGERIRLGRLEPVDPDDNVLPRLDPLPTQGM